MSKFRGTIQHVREFGGTHHPFPKFRGSLIWDENETPVFPALPDPDPVPPAEPVKYYLTFSSDNSFTIVTKNAAKNWDGTLYYSTDAKTWNKWGGTITIASAQHSGEHRLYMRGSGNTVITGGTQKQWILSGSNIRCVGDIENLLDYETVAKGEHPKMGEKCYQVLFVSCDALISAPTLPATTLTRLCYCSMFEGCSNLSTPPQLPATELAETCYKMMFYKCKNLTAPPSLPATTLAEDCYNTMFRDCYSLTTTPQLPATELAERCYFSMFQNCTSLTMLPRLPATDLKGNCYGYMFDNCINIKLSEEQTGEYRTAYRIPTTDTGTTAYMALHHMFTSTGGTFTGTPEINKTYYTSNEVV